jgi:hypothetical protein
MDQTPLLDRAWRAYLATDRTSLDQPDARDSGEQVFGGLRYVVLRHERRTLAVYRVRGNGLLRRMKRWPLELGRASAPHRRIGATRLSASP